MITIMLFGIGVIALNIFINIWQLQPGIKAVAELNANVYGWGDRMLYPFRFICILPKLIVPILLDIIVVGLGGTIGLGGGVMGAVIGIAAACLLSMAIKLSLSINKSAAKRRHYVAN